MSDRSVWIPKQIAIIGCGMIGASWAAYFLSKGIEVVAFAPESGTPDTFAERVQLAKQSIPDVPGITVAPARLLISRSQADAVAKADLIVENAPENVELKCELISCLQSQALPTAIIASSTSSLKHSDIASKSADPTRVVIAHPFNPPHLIPLVELFGIDPEVVERLRAFYQAIGKQPVVMNKEMIGHVANRLTAALWREALYMLQEGVASAADIDTAVTAGPGLRWAIQGPFLTYHLGGGGGGIRHYLEHLGPSQQKRWASLGEPRMDQTLTEQIVAGVELATDGRSLEELGRYRDELLVAIAACLKQAK
ncbi:3-hydroxyacyl-CoA dehydrogenase NAD-binding domain-containing protein [Marinobacter sp. BSs20148]|jgi:carnitine 3-dehydrogenase|uniref:3-hydroxyacyl-CoA dehydrogenase NAD-binding domain-containing protein n=1 Tax=Marinobacter TaxID=2742 RepID=UPI000277678D|nr:3-hydroxyacyl-CoA dehydrogenase NAD-binding domain-containing protein [Marinobacter sp. BSs20148]AFP30764.1 NAD-binding 3-hydroxyacyl-CoA dehydrogenase [Marinobacter sp. BSs20148]